MFSKIPTFWDRASMWIWGLAGPGRPRPGTATPARPSLRAPRSGTVRSGPWRGGVRPSRGGTAPRARPPRRAEARPARSSIAPSDRGGREVERHVAEGTRTLVHDPESQQALLGRAKVGDRTGRRPTGSPGVGLDLRGVRPGVGADVGESSPGCRAPPGARPAPPRPTARSGRTAPRTRPRTRRRPPGAPRAGGRRSPGRTAPRPESAFHTRHNHRSSGGIHPNHFQNAHHGGFSPSGAGGGSVAGARAGEGAGAGAPGAAGASAGSIRWPRRPRGLRPASAPPFSGRPSGRTPRSPSATPPRPPSGRTSRARPRGPLACRQFRSSGPGTSPRATGGRARGRPRGLLVHDEAGDLLAAAAPHHPGLVGVDDEPFVADDAADRAEQRLDALRAAGEREIVGVAGVGEPELARRGRSAAGRAGRRSGW